MQAQQQQLQQQEHHHQQPPSFAMSVFTDPTIAFDMLCSSSGTTPAHSPAPSAKVSPTVASNVGDDSATQQLTTKRGTSGPTRNLRIDNLPMNIDAAELREMFECFGPVVSHKLMMDAFTGKSRGIAFIQFERDADATSAVEKMDGSVLGESTLTVQYARENTRAPTVPTSRAVLRYVPAETSAATIRQLISVKTPSVSIVELTFQPDPRPHLVIVLITLRSPLEAQMVVDALNRKVKLMPKPEHAHPGIPEYLLSVPVSAKLCDEALLDKTVERVRIAEAQRALTQVCNTRPANHSGTSTASPLTFVSPSSMTVSSSTSSNNSSTLPGNWIAVSQPMHVFQSGGSMMQQIPATPLVQPQWSAHLPHHQQQQQSAFYGVMPAMPAGSMMFVVPPQQYATPMPYVQPQLQQQAHQLHPHQQQPQHAQPQLHMHQAAVSPQTLPAKLQPTAGYVQPQLHLPPQGQPQNAFAQPHVQLQSTPSQSNLLKPQQHQPGTYMQPQLQLPQQSQQPSQPPKLQQQQPQTQQEAPQQQPTGHVQPFLQLQPQAQQKPQQHQPGTYMQPQLQLPQQSQQPSQPKPHQPQTQPTGGFVQPHLQLQSTQQQPPPQQQGQPKPQQYLAGSYVQPHIQMHQPTQPQQQQQLLSGGFLQPQLQMPTSPQPGSSPPNVHSQQPFQGGHQVNLPAQSFQQPSRVMPMDFMAAQQQQQQHQHPQPQQHSWTFGKPTAPPSS